MTLLNAPTYNEHAERTRRAVIIGSISFVVLLILVALGGFLFGHGWFFSNLPAEHKVNNFFSALQAQDYNKAFAIYNNDPDWQQHPNKYKDYPITRFTEDWTTDSPVGGPVLAHHVDISKTDGTGAFGSGIIVAVRADSAREKDKKIFMWVNRADGTLTEPAPHILQY